MAKDRRKGTHKGGGKGQRKAPPRPAGNTSGRAVDKTADKPGSTSKGASKGASKSTSKSKPKSSRDRFHVTVKTRAKRSLSSKLWLERQLNDPYVERARREGYRSRAAYKLKEIDERYMILKSGQAIVDLGAAPGGWSQIAARKVGALERRGRVIAIDILDMPEIPGVEFLQLDFLDDSAPERLRSMLGGRADIVMSDMAANTTGHRPTDQLRIMALVESAAHFAREVLKPEGVFLAKVFQSGADAALQAQLKRDFRTVRHVKPAASRADSSERYLLATGFRHGR